MNPQLTPKGAFLPDQGTTDTFNASNWTLDYQTLNGRPHRLVVDDIRLVLMMILFVTGTPININALMLLRRSMLSSVTPLKQLKLNLSISDLMILLVYTGSQIIWLITVDWRSSDMMCRLVKFSHALCFSASSNVIVCIALHRLSVVEGWEQRTLTKTSLTLAWILAVVTSSPQFFVWTAYRPSETATWQQCVSVWFVREYEMRRSNGSAVNVGTSNPFLSATAYNVCHVLIIFWIPAALVTATYIRLVTRVSQEIFCECRPRFRRISMDVRLIGEWDSNNRGVSCTARMLSKPLSSGHNRPPYEVARMFRHRCHTIRRKRKAIRTCMLLVTTYIVCWLPYNAFLLWELIDRNSYLQWYTTYTSLLSYLIVFNAVINPFIYLASGRTGFCFSHAQSN